MTSDLHQQLYRLNLGNVLLLYRLIACAIYERELKDPEIREFINRIRGRGDFSDAETLQATRRLLDRAHKGKLKGADDAYARILSLAVDIYLDPHSIDDEDDLPVIWCDTWLNIISMTMVKDFREVEAKMLQITIQFEGDLLSSIPLPTTTQQTILKSFSQS